MLSKSKLDELLLGAIVVVVVAETGALVCDGDVPALGGEVDVPLLDGEGELLVLFVKVFACLVTVACPPAVKTDTVMELIEDISEGTVKVNV